MTHASTQGQTCPVEAIYMTSRHGITFSYSVHMFTDSPRQLNVFVAIGGKESCAWYIMGDYQELFVVNLYSYYALNTTKALHTTSLVVCIIPTFCLWYPVVFCFRNLGKYLPQAMLAHRIQQRPAWTQPDLHINEQSPCLLIMLTSGHLHTSSKLPFTKSQFQRVFCRKDDGYTGIRTERHTKEGQQDMLNIPIFVLNFKIP